MNENIDEILESLDKDALNYFIKHYSNGGSSEFDKSINNISRAYIQKYYEKHGKCFLGKINDYDNYGKNPEIVFTPYTGQLVYNFEFAFVIPEEDEELRRLLVIHNNTEKEKFDSSTTEGLINKISDRIKELGGYELSWS